MKLENAVGWGDETQSVKEQVAFGLERSGHLIPLILSEFWRLWIHP